MNYAPQIVDTFKASPVERILLVDDAYDPPEFDTQHAGELLETLTAEGLRDHVSEYAFCEEVCSAAVTALNDNELEHDAITEALAALYVVFLETRSDAVDPGGVFAESKGASLEVLDPLVELLHRCGDDTIIKKVGTGDAAVIACRDLRPDVVFMDFYLSPPERTTQGITKGQRDGDRERSIKLLKLMLSADIDVEPAVVLMSSEDVGNRKETYLHRLENRVMALRFGYLYKEWVRGAGEDLTASGDAADVLIDTSGSFDFARTLEEALKAWKKGAEEALQQLYRELRDFDVKDFAYLLRFRLYDEGEPFADYLEWYLGESLRAIVDNKVEWTTNDFTRLNDSELIQAIEGAHPLPSVRIAQFFHRMRFNSWEVRQRVHFWLGDLFVAPNGKGVRMIISPDCDLVPRKNGKPAASRLLTIGGKIRGLQEDRAFAGELIFHNSPKAIQWDFKDLMTHEIRDTAVLDVNDTLYEYFASMRAMPAQTIQKLALADLSRVALAAPPTVDVGAPVKVYLKMNVDNQAQVVELEGVGSAYAQVLMPRGGKDTQKRALFSSKFVRELLAKLEALAEDDLLVDHRQYWRECIENTERLGQAMLRDGLALPGETVFKLTTSVGDRRNKSWLEIVIDVSDEALMDLRGSYPLDPENGI